MTCARQGNSTHEVLGGGAWNTHANNDELWRLRRGPRWMAPNGGSSTVWLVLLLGLNWLFSLAGAAGATFAESSVFAFDTRDSNSTHYAESGVFAFNTRAFDGLSGKSASGSFSFDTRTLGLPTLAVTGPGFVNPGTPGQFTSLATYPGLPPENVTNSAAWSITGGPPGTAISRGRVTAGKGAGGIARITASIRLATGQRTSLPFDVAVGPSLRVFFTSPAVTASNRTGQSFTWRVKASAVTAPAAPTANYAWSWNATAITGQTGPSVDFSFVGPAGSGELTVVVTDTATGSAGFGYQTVVYDKPPVANEGLARQTSGKVEEGAYLTAQGGAFAFNDTNRRNTGLIVLTHGLLLDDDTEGQRTWLKEMAELIDTRVLIEKGAANRPYVLLYDWLHDARATKDFDTDEANKLVVDYFQKFGDELVGASDAAMVDSWFEKLRKQDRFTPSGEIFTDSARRAWEAQKPKIRDAIVNGVLSRDRGKQHGEFLAKRLLDRVGTDLNGQTPIHLIGHSAGGFVVGECAYQLKKAGYAGPILVTMLDTPFPWVHHQPKPGSGIRTERYISSLFGGGRAARQWDAESTTVTPVLNTGYSGASYQPYVISTVHTFPPSCEYHRFEIPDVVFGFHPVADHAYAHQWYLDETVRVLGAQNGFYHSPFLGDHPWACAPATPSPASAFAKLAANAVAPLGPFQTYGSVSANAGAYVLTEVDNAGIYHQMTLPVGASKFKFEYRFTSPGDGDFLQVFANEGTPLFVGSDTTLARAGYVSTEIDVSAFAGEAVRLDLKLVSRGDPNAVLSIRNITLETSDDLDNDGLSNATELANGTSPWLVDTDGDGFSDAYESLVSETDPTLADTDGDGADDLQEYLSGTNPLDVTSVFRIIEAKWNPGGGLVLRWRGVLGQSYQVQRSETVDFESYDVVASGVAATAPLTNYTDAAASPAANPRLFYRVALDFTPTAQGDDGDFDGLGTAQEATAGSNPALYDTDGDGLSDGEEVLVLHTSPTRADTDGDGSSDWAELVAGTDPANVASLLKVTSITRSASGSVTLNWTGVAGRTYRVLRSLTPDFSNPETIHTGWPGLAPITTFTDTSAGAVSNATLFYKVAVE